MYYVARIELSEKQNNAEYVKQYRLKRKLLLQHQASTSSETEILQEQKKAERNTAKTKKRQNTLNKIQIKKSKILPCMCAAVRHIHVKRRASLREAWLIFYLEMHLRPYGAPRLAACGKLKVGALHWMRYSSFS
jgi:hypothetical protein